MRKLRLVAFLLLTIGINAQSEAIVETEIENSCFTETGETEVKPTVEGGMYTLSMYISQNLSLPDVHNRKFKLFIGFIVEAEGTISDVKFIHLLDEKLNENGADAVNNTNEAAQIEAMKIDAMRLIQTFPGKWLPALRNGLPVRCQYNYPLTITIE